MTLKEYIKSHGLTHEAFGKLIGGVPQTTVSRYIRGDRFPARETILLIKEVTNGEVDIVDWYAPSEAAQ